VQNSSKDRGSLWRTVISRSGISTKVIGRAAGSSVSVRDSTVAVMNRLPLSWYSRLDASISCISAWVGTSMPRACSTSVSSSGVGRSMSIQTAPGGISVAPATRSRRRPCFT
jgi:hypothetical protein